jgi:membrane protein
VQRSVRFQWPGILLLAWTGRRTFGALFSALDAVFERPGRNFAKGNLVALAMVTLTGIGVLSSMALAMVVATAEGVLHRLTGEAGTGLLHGFSAFVLTRAFPALVTLTFFFILYRFAPKKVRWREALAGALIASVLWELAKAGFAYYVRDLAHSAGLYGALEGIIILGLWLELSVSIVLYGGEIVVLLSPVPPAIRPGSEV